MLLHDPIFTESFSNDKALRNNRRENGGSTESEKWLKSTTVNGICRSLICFLFLEYQLILQMHKIDVTNK